MTKVDHIKNSVHWHKTKFFCWFTFWAIYLDSEDHKYYALTFSYKFQAEGDSKEQKLDCYNRGWAFIEEMLFKNKAILFEGFDPVKAVQKEYDVFAVAPFDLPLSESQSQVFEEFMV